jgi:hypothetical protein
MYKTYFLQNWLPGWNEILTQLRFIHNSVITSIQWMVHQWGAGSLWPTFVVFHVQRRVQRLHLLLIKAMHLKRGPPFGLSRNLEVVTTWVVSGDPSLVWIKWVFTILGVNECMKRENPHNLATRDFLKVIMRVIWKVVEGVNSGGCWVPEIMLFWTAHLLLITSFLCVTGKIIHHL